MNNLLEERSIAALLDLPLRKAELTPSDILDLWHDWLAENQVLIRASSDRHIPVVTGLCVVECKYSQSLEDCRFCANLDVANSDSDVWFVMEAKAEKHWQINTPFITDGERAIGLDAAALRLVGGNKWLQRYRGRRLDRDSVKTAIDRYCSSL